MKAITLKKLAYVVPRPRYYRALAHRVLPTVEHRHAFKGLEFDTVLDIGANKGQFAAFAAARWPNAEIHCFEPYPPAADKLQALMGDRVTVHRTALGAQDGTQVLHVASADDSSSLLELSDTQKTHFAMDEVAQIDVPVTRLDRVFQHGLPKNSLVKIDVQGFEDAVMTGSTFCMATASAIYIELSHVELYAGQPLASTIDGMLNSHGFKHTASYNLSFKGVTLLQADYLYKRNTLLNDATRN